MNAKIVTAAWLNDNLNDNSLIILDASPKSNVSGETTEYEGQQIPNSRSVDLKESFSDKEGLFPNTVPSAEYFEKECRKLGINKTSKVVIYDNLGIYTSPRVWWLFKIMGHNDVAVLDGGLPEWITEGYETILQENQATATTYEAGNFEAKLQTDLVKTYEDVLENTTANDFVVVDARSAGRFAGTVPEPRKGLKSGSIPNSVNIPYQDVLENGKFKSADKLNILFKEITSNAEDLVFSCGSGLTACIIMLANELSVNKGTAVFDGSWTEWAEREGLKE
jgi:thiosulfate/3-mercaptopyruvate sulfurtransferase